MEKKKTKFDSNSIRFAALAVDALCFRILGDELQVLLCKVSSNDNIYKGKLAHIGGLIHVDEVAEESLERLLKDKAGIKDIYKEQLYTFTDVERDFRGRVVSVAYIALTHDKDVQDLEKASMETKWINVRKIPKLAYDHNKITEVALERLQSKINYTNIAKHFLPEEFTLSDMQKVYEVVLGNAMDKRNFRKKILTLNILKDTKRKVKNGVMRPASLYTFK